MSASIHPQGFIIWGSQDPSTKYALVLSRHALSYARDLFSQLHNSVFFDKNTPILKLIFKKSISLENSNPDSKADFPQQVKK